MSFHCIASHLRGRLLPSYSLGLPLRAELSCPFHQPGASSPTPPPFRTFASACLPEDTDGRSRESEALGNEAVIHCNPFGIHRNNAPSECSFQCAIRQELWLCVVLITSTYCQVLLRILPLRVREPLVLATDFRNVLWVGVSAKLPVMRYCSWFVFWTLMRSAEVCKLP